jgi:hypothetical protein
MTVDRRLSAVEAALTPTQRILVWLDEAHAHGSIAEYVASLLDVPAEDYPLNRLLHGAANSTRASFRGKPTPESEAAVRGALREVTFRFELVTRANVVAHEALDLDAFAYAAFTSQVALLVSEDRKRRREDAQHLERLASVRDAMFAWVDGLLARQEARAVVERRYLDGHPTIFPAVAAFWAERVLANQEAAVMADALAELDGARPFVIPDEAAIAAGVERRVDDLVTHARVMALEKLDEGRRAIAIATAWTRSRLVDDKPSAQSL